MGRRLGGEGAREEARIEVLAMSGELARHDGRESLALQSLAIDLAVAIALLEGEPPGAAALERARRRLATAASVVGQLRRWDLRENAAHAAFAPAAFALGGIELVAAAAGVA
jgi:hypothetical protein